MADERHGTMLTRQGGEAGRSLCGANSGLAEGFITCGHAQQPCGARKRIPGTGRESDSERYRGGNACFLEEGLGDGGPSRGEDRSRFDRAAQCARGDAVILVTRANNSGDGRKLRSMGASSYSATHLAKSQPRIRVL